MRRKRLMIAIIIILLISIIALLIYAPPALTLLRLNGFKPYEVLWEYEKPNTYNSRFYLIQSDGELWSAVFWKDENRWNYLADLNTSEEVTMIGTSFPAIENGDPDIIHYCMIAAPEDDLQEYVSGYSPPKNIDGTEFVTKNITTENGSIIAACGASSADQFGSKDLVWLVINQ